MLLCGVGWLYTFLGCRSGVYINHLLKNELLIFNFSNLAGDFNLFTYAY